MKISFLATITLPPDYSKSFVGNYLASPKHFLQDWLSGALSNIVEGPPLEHGGATVEVTFVRENNTVLRME